MNNIKPPDKNGITHLFSDFLVKYRHNYNDCVVGSFSRAALKKIGYQKLRTISSEENTHEKFVSLFESISQECLDMFERTWDKYVKECDK
jgi:hypothetical protein